MPAASGQGFDRPEVYSLCREWHSEQRLFEDRKLHEAILCCVPVPTRYAPGGTWINRTSASRLADDFQIPAPVLPSLTRAPSCTVV